VTEVCPPRAAVELPPRGRFIGLQALAWLLAAPLLGAAVARAAVWAEHVRAPLLIFPLLIGGGLGLLLVAMMRVLNIGHRPTLLIGAVLAAVVAAAGQHYIHFRDYADARAAFLAQKQDGGLLGQFQKVMPTVAPSFSDYMRGQARRGRAITADYSLRGAAAWASWALDGMLLLAAAVAIVYVFSRSPYCRVCRSWYRLVRGGRVDGATAARLAEAAGLKIDEPVATARYRLSHCASGCGSARFQLACDDGKGSTRQGEAWLAAAEREGVVRVLDKASVGWEKRASASAGPP
jgi:hypothetical protein